MGGSWPPSWLGALGVVVFVCVALVHVRHATIMGGRSRLWHVAHVAMAVGMVDMYWPGSETPVSYRTGVAVCGLATAAAVTYVVIDAVRGRPPWWLGILTAVDLGAMTYMFAMFREAWVPVTVVLVGWLAFESIGWLSGTWSTVHRQVGLDSSPGPSTSTAPGVPAVGNKRLAGVTLARRSASALEARHDGMGAEPVLRWRLRVSLAVMSLGMGYMLIVMQWSMPAGPTMQDMPGMSGHEALHSPPVPISTRAD